MALCPASTPEAGLSFLSLPSEIHQLVAENLAYPDLLSLTLTHPLFYQHPYIRTSKSSRVDWLIDRARLHLPIPAQRRCRWSSDLEFVSNAEVVEILRKRRHHEECAEVFLRGRSDGICFVNDSKTCQHLSDHVHQLGKLRRVRNQALFGLKRSGIANPELVDCLGWKVLGIAALVVVVAFFCLEIFPQEI